MSILNNLNILKIVISLLPIIRTAVDQIEDLFPQGGYGQQKLAMLKTILQTVIDTTDLGSGVFLKIWPLVMDIVAKLVALKNATKPVTVTVANIPPSIAK